MDWQIIVVLGLAALVIGWVVWRRKRPKPEASWPAVSRSRGGAPHAAIASHDRPTAGGIDNSGSGHHDGPSPGSGN